MKKITLDKTEKVLRVLLAANADDEVRRALFTAIQVLSKAKTMQADHVEFLQAQKEVQDMKSALDRRYASENRIHRALELACELIPADKLLSGCASNEPAALINKALARAEEFLKDNDLADKEKDLLQRYSGMIWKGGHIIR